MDESTHELLSDPALPFVRKLQIAAAIELVFWEDRFDPPNLSVQEFRRILPLIPLSTQPSWVPRKSVRGKYGNTGEWQVFKFEFQLMLLGRRHQFFVKGYFFEEGKLHGVEVQSFRRTKKPSARLRTV